nr:mannose-1-phosphate guanylyltransferase [Qipengyuania qiaonensis]
MCGGSGTRLWPRSRKERPKPFIQFVGDKTLYQSTLSRCSDREIFARPIIVVGEKHLELALPQAAEVAPDALFVVEPMGRNTAPAIALAAMALEPDDIMLVCPSDHRIRDTKGFENAAVKAANLAKEDWLVSFGIEATAPETGYGYIRRGAKLDGGHEVQRFVEKPDLATAKALLDEGSYAWNGGIFAFRAGHFLAELDKYRPDLQQATRLAFQGAEHTETTIKPDAASFAKVNGESVDYAVMENTDRAAVVDVSMGWSDIGNWDALFEERKRPDEDNVVVGQGEIIGAKGAMIDSDRAHVTLIGADNVVVVVDGDDILVTTRDAVQRVAEAERCKSQ